MLSGKCGLVYCHMGAAKEGLQPLTEAVAMSDVPITQFLPTHVERTPELIAEGAKWVKAGGRVNLTCRTDEVVHLCPDQHRLILIRNCHSVYSLCVSLADLLTLNLFNLTCGANDIACSNALPLGCVLSAHNCPCTKQ